MNRYTYIVRATRALKQARFHPTAYCLQDLQAAWMNGVTLEYIQRVAQANRGTDVPLNDLIY